MSGMAALLGAVLCGLSVPWPALDNIWITAPDGWAVWAVNNQETIYQAPDPETEAAFLRIWSTDSAPLEESLVIQVRRALQERKAVRVSPVHVLHTDQGLAARIQVVTNRDGQGRERQTFVAVVRREQRTVAVQFETGQAETLSRHYGTLLRMLAGVRFGQCGH